MYFPLKIKQNKTTAKILARTSPCLQGCAVGTGVLRFPVSLELSWVLHSLGQRLLVLILHAACTLQIMLLSFLTVCWDTETLKPDLLTLKQPESERGWQKFVWKQREWSAHLWVFDLTLKTSWMRRSDFMTRHTCEDEQNERSTKQ